MPEGTRDDHLKILTELSKKLVDPEVKKTIKNAPFAEVVDLINSIKVGKKKEETAKQKGDLFIVGITACPTGIAHTFMAQQSIIDAAKRLGAKYKVETQGAGGLDDELTKKEIAEADAIVISAGIALEKMERFNGFEGKIFKSPLQKTIADADGVVEKAIKVGEDFKKNGGLQTAGSTSDVSFVEEEESNFRIFMGHLMSGIGAMLPVIIVAGTFMGFTSIFNMAYYFNTGQST